MYERKLINKKSFQVFSLDIIQIDEVNDELKTDGFRRRGKRHFQRKQFFLGSISRGFMNISGEFYSQIGPDNFGISVPF